MSANIKNENTERVDLTSILKDVENCIKSGLSNKLDTFFYEYDKYKKTHEEVLNLSIVKELLKNGSYVSEDIKPKMDPEYELIVLRNQVIFLRAEVNKYQAQVKTQARADADAEAHTQINLEIKEKEKEKENYNEQLDIKSEDDGDGDGGDGDVSEASDISKESDVSEDNIQNIVLNVTEKEEAEAEEEEEDIPVKMPTFPTKNIVEVKSVVVEEAEADAEADADAEDDVETETEEEEAEAEDEEEEELFEVEINGVMYVSNDDEDGTIYAYVNEEVGDKVGEFKGKVAHIYTGKNKGIYDRTKCKMDF